MNGFKNKWKVTIPGWIFMLLMPVLNELMLHCWITESLKMGTLLRVLGFGLAFGAVLALPVSFIKNHRVQKWVAVALGLFLTVVYVAEYFLNDAYQAFMGLTTILDSAGGVMSDYTEMIISLVLRNIWRIVLALMPIAGYALFAQGGDAKTAHRIGIVLCGATVAMGMYSLSGTRLTTAFHFDTAVRDCGLAVSMVTDVFAGEREDTESEFVAIQPVVEETVESYDAAKDVQSSEPTVEYGENVMDFDFEALAETERSSTIASIHRYVASQVPSKQNAYTGLFAGKNLILITAESFAAEVIDPELTPTLYRLATKGMQFTEYYQPLWGGSTSTGEFSILTGLVQASGSASMKEGLQQKLFLNIGHQLMNLGYSSAAYHNHLHTYYDRHLTEVGMGYSKFIGVGNGMEITKQWPRSDLEMMEATVDQYIDQQPFSIYYMTVSGHGLYLQDGNANSRKNYHVFADMDYSERIKCYLAANMELEYALSYLVSRLEEAGIADDTVIVIAADHYPYALERSSTWYNDKEYVSELYGFTYSNDAGRDHNRLIIWSGCIEDMNIVVDTPVYSLDILPTLSNLFGVEYDSRLLVGRDVFSDQMPLVLWPNYNWKTEKGFYEFRTNTFTPDEGMEASEEYIANISAIVKNKVSYSKSVQKHDYFDILLESVATSEDNGG